MARLSLGILLLSSMVATVHKAHAGNQAQTGSYVDPNSATESTTPGKWLEITKTPPTQYITRGEQVNFTIDVTNKDKKFEMGVVIVSDPTTQSCNRYIGDLAPGETYQYDCAAKYVQEAFTNEAVVTGKNGTNGQKDSASATARVEIVELKASIVPQPSSISVPGALVTFAVTVTNNGSTGVQLTGLTSSQLGDLADPQNPLLQNNSCPFNGNLPELKANGGILECDFSAQIEGPPGDYTFDLITGGLLGGSEVVKANASSMVTIYEMITSSLAASNAEVPSGGKVELTATIKNVSKAKDVKITGMSDTLLGDVTSFGNCNLPQLLAPGETYSCKYVHTATAAVGTTQTFVLNVMGETDEKPPVAANAQASASIKVAGSLVYLPLSIDRPPPTTCSTALPVSTNVRYQFYLNISDAFYKFVLTEAAKVTVELGNFTSTDGQILVYKNEEGTCSSESLRLIGHNGDDTKERIIPVGVQPPSDYLVRVYNGGSLSVAPYTLFIRAE